MPVRGSCDLPAMCLRVCDFSKFVIVRIVKKIIEAMMPVYAYDDRRVYLRWPHGKGDFDIVNSSEGKCNQGISYRETHFFAYIWDSFLVQSTYVRFVSVPRVQEQAAWPVSMIHIYCCFFSST